MVDELGSKVGAKDDCSKFGARKLERFLDEPRQGTEACVVRASAKCRTRGPHSLLSVGGACWRRLLPVAAELVAARTARRCWAYRRAVEAPRSSALAPAPGRARAASSSREWRSSLYTSTL